MMHPAGEFSLYKKCSTLKASPLFDLLLLLKYNGEYLKNLKTKMMSQKTSCTTNIGQNTVVL